MNHPVALSVVLFVASFALETRGQDVELLGVKKIWDQAPHNAFTDLIRHDGAWYCTFREGSGHVPGTDGKVRVIKSADGEAWESAALLEEKGVDLRDPKVSLAPDGRLMLVMGGSIYDGVEGPKTRKRVSSHTRVSFSKDGREWTPPKPVDGIADDHWLWRVTWHKGVGYGAVYSTEDRTKFRRTLTVWRTADGVKYERPIEPKPPVNLSEATVRFLADDSMVILLRGEEKDRHAWVGVSKPPYERWEWKDGGRAAQGPNFIVMGDGRMFYSGRDFPDGKGARTVFGRMTLEKLDPLATFPSGGDTSYPGLVEAGDGVVWVSYYASHEKKSAIYLARVRVGK